MSSIVLRLFYRAVNYLRPPQRRVFLNPIHLLDDLRGRELVEQFNDLFYRLHGGGMRCKGSPIIKNPCDLWVISELLEDIKPRVIVETGTAEGGSALWLADISNALGLETEIVTIDVNPKCNFTQTGIHQVIGYSTDHVTAATVKRLIGEIQARKHGAVMVFLDSDHAKENVDKELSIYSEFVTKGSYLVVEDTNINGHPSFPTHGPGPHEAVQEFLLSHPNFVADREREKYLLTFNPGGYLRRDS